MKTRLIIIAIFAMFINVAMAKDGQPKKRVVFIKTNAQCEDCKERIEKVLNFEKGIIYAELHLDTKDVEVKYNSKKTSLDKIKKTISEIGYSADEVDADKDAQELLPMCCRPGGH